MSFSHNVILGEAPESDSEEEIPLGDTNDNRPQDHRLQSNQPQDYLRNHKSSSVVDQPAEGAGGFSFTASLISSTLGSATSIASRLVNYSSSTADGTLSTGHQLQAPTTSSSGSSSGVYQLPPLHKTLLAKNYQLFACMGHIYKHPYEKAAKELYLMSQRLVGVQRNIQEVEEAVIKLGNEQKNLEFDIKCIV